MRSQIILFHFLTALLAALCLSQSTMADVPFSEVADLPYRAPDQTIRYGSKPLQIAEYWQSNKDGPLLFLVHGGCWLNAYDRSHIRPLAAAIADHGIAVLSVEYRRIGDSGGGWPGSFDDLRAALKEATTLDHRGIYLAGHSAGGHMALWLASSRQAQIKGVIGLAAISDLHLYAAGKSGCEKATVQLMGGTPEDFPDRYTAASPLLLGTKTATLLIHGDHDRIVNTAQSTHFSETYPDTTLRLLPGKGHFDLVDPRQEVAEIIAEQIRLWQH